MPLDIIEVIEGKGLGRRDAVEGIDRRQHIDRADIGQVALGEAAALMIIFITEQQLVHDRTGHKATRKVEL